MERLVPGNDQSHQPRQQKMFTFSMAKVVVVYAVYGNCFFYCSSRAPPSQLLLKFATQHGGTLCRHWSLINFLFGRILILICSKPIMYVWAVAIVGGDDLASCFVKHPHLFLCSLWLLCQPEPFLPRQSEVVKGK